MTKTKDEKLKNKIEDLNKHIEDSFKTAATDVYFDPVTRLSNFDLVFSLISFPVLKEIYDRLEEGDRAIRENKAIKGSLDTVANHIKGMYNLI